MKNSRTIQFNLRAALLLFVPIALILFFGVDWYRHAGERQEALASLNAIGLNHEFDSSGSEGNQVSFYSTTSHFDSSNTSDILRHLKTVSQEHNSFFRFGYGIHKIDFRNAEPNFELIEELQAAFPDTKISHQKTSGG